MSAPESFAGVHGHAQAQAMLRRSIERDRLHHALILAGPDGVGKRALALALAAAMLCELAPGRGCERCDACRRVREGKHTDVVWLQGEGRSDTIRVDAAREVITSSLRAPFEGHAHFVIIDPADRMMLPAANALLKSLEEPRPGVHYLLLSENPSEILPTVRSRCTALSLGPLGSDDLRRVVDEVLRSRALEVDADALRTALSLADGRPGRALELATDPSLPTLRRLLGDVLAAASGDRARLFGGDGGSLWSTWKEAVSRARDPELEPEPELPPAVIQKGRKGRRKKTKAKAPPAWGTPYQQRKTLARLTELWLVHLGHRLRGAAGLVDDPHPRSADELMRQIRAVQGLQSSIARNPNVRLSLERTLLEAGRRG